MRLLWQAEKQRVVYFPSLNEQSLENGGEHSLIIHPGDPLQAVKTLENVAVFNPNKGK